MAAETLVPDALFYSGQAAIGFGSSAGRGRNRRQREIQMGACAHCCRLIRRESERELQSIRSSVARVCMDDDDEAANPRRNIRRSRSS